MSTDFDANDNDTSAADSVDSSVPDTPTDNSNPGRSKYGCTYKRTTTMHYDPTTGELLVLKLRRWLTITNVSRTQMARWNSPTWELA